MRAVLALVLALAIPAHAQPFQDAQVQSPELARPQRGSIGGPLAREAFGPGQLGSGAFSMPAPFKLPNERGTIELDPVPSYSPEHGLSEWGLGWGRDLSIRRFRVLGHIDFRGDDRMGPWGRMVKGSDGAWYPIGLQTAVRVVEQGTSLVALMPNGSRITFGAATRETTAEGTYAWYPDAVETLDGSRTAYSYDVRGGRPWLTRITYGTGQQQLELVYEPVPRPTTTLRSGAPVTLDRRVKRVELSSLESGRLALRWSYALGYEDDAWGVAFYLTSVQRTFAGGAVEPAIRYRYVRPSDAITAARFAKVPELATVLGRRPAEVIQPHRSAQLDPTGDGLVDLELANDFSLLRRTPHGFALDAPPPAPANADARCRPAVDPNNAPRMVARISPTSDERVFSIATDATGVATELRTCDRDGRRRTQQTVPGVWAPNARTRLVELTGDGIPELVQLDNGSVRVRSGELRNGEYAVGAESRAPLQPQVTADTLWIQDWNGDGIADLIGRTRGGLLVWYGRGRGRFLEDGVLVKLETTAGPISDLAPFQLTFADVNRDGLTDAILTRNAIALLYVNDGRALVERRVPAFSAIDWQSGAPVVVDLTGSGELQLAALKAGEVWAVDVTAAAAGLLASVEDGRGVEQEYRYARAAPIAGLRSRPIILSQLTITTAGEATEQFRYDFAEPQIDPKTGVFLGFQRVRRVTKHGWLEALMRHTPEQAGLVTRLGTFDHRDPNVHRYAETEWNDTTVRGVRAYQRAQERERWHAPVGGSDAVGEITRYSYDGLCPTRVTKRAGADELVTTLSLANPARLRGHLHCLEERRALSGRHAQRDLDFDHLAVMQHDASGRLTAISVVGGGRTLPLQTIRYDAVGLIESIDAIDRGRTTYAWDRATRELSEVRAPDGTVTRAAGRDPRTSAITALAHDLGTLRRTEQFRYDGFERLAASWDDVGSSTSSAPDLRYEYAFSTPERPGQIRQRALLDAASGTVQETIDLISAGDASIGTLTLGGNGWILSPLTWTRETGVRERMIPTAITVQPATIDFAGLQGGQLADRTTSYATGGSLLADRYHADSTRLESTQHEVANGTLLKHSMVAGRSSHTLTLLPGGQVGERREADGSRYAFRWDRLGRFRGMTSPDRTVRVDYDAFGRIATTTWAGWMTIRNTFRTDSMLVASKTYVAPDNSVLRRVDYTHDRIGRVVRETHASGSSPRVEFASIYDHAPQQCGWTASETGNLMAVTGPQYVTCYRRDAANHIVRQRDVIANVLELESEYTYYDDGSVRREQRRVTRPGQPPVIFELHRALDGHGRPNALRVTNGDTIQLELDARGRPWRATTQTAAGWIERDPTTDRVIGAGARRGTERWATRTHLAPDGNPDEERFEVDGTATIVRYGVTPRGFLTRARGVDDWQYEYDPSGLMTAVTHDAVRTPITRTRSRITRGAASWDVDPLGRVTKRDQARFDYRGDSQLHSITSPQGTWTFVTDAAGQRRARFRGGVFERADLAGIEIVGSQIRWPIELEGRVIGMFENGRFVPHMTDAMETSRVEARRLRKASPYGEGPRIAGSFDFHRGIGESAGGTVRLGVRDFAPELGSFLTPDPLFLEDPGACVEHATDCNLYGFAAGNPVRSTDRTGFATRTPSNPRAAKPPDAPRGPASFLVRMMSGIAAHLVFTEMLVRQNGMGVLDRFEPGIKADTKIFTAARVLGVPMSYNSMTFVLYAISGRPDAMNVSWPTISTLELKPAGSLELGREQQRGYKAEAKAYGLGHKNGTPAEFGMPARFESFFFTFTYQDSGVYTYSFKDNYRELEKLADVLSWSAFFAAASAMGPMPTPTPMPALAH